ncbi:branched-chain amino acid transport system ATP-binding protein [Atopostipes suicloacalis DSM 15692]|uniref:Branched-chain amino acid transport system ATP-binding protein n=1 Tax=Atopostipes suicloacalis DSM 15692 TaxID=1121025 RepID=A0A1M4XX64_9LACT|nr:ABC transporter ATP-binding protein [Atopostipes suicloacalis]SHE98025.1 branched-chain amino acid transport system ATP-binding protein [Atopostipes suicloacalis DSM 15692]
MLKIEDVVVHYGVIEAIKRVTFEVNKGEIVSLIGANGAGKTTILNSISGLIQPTSGEIRYKNKPIIKTSTRDIVAAGISQVPEGRRVFNGMSVKENLEMGAFLRKDRAEIQKDLERVYESFPILKERLNQDAQTLSGGEQQMLAMGRALLSNPEVLLLDEPSMGLAPLFIKEIFNIIEEISERGTTILLVEQNATIALEISDRGYVIETGKIVASGSAQELLDSDEIQKAYLGG